MSLVVRTLAEDKATERRKTLSVSQTVSSTRFHPLFFFVFFFFFFWFLLFFFVAAVQSGTQSKVFKARTEGWQCRFVASILSILYPSVLSMLLFLLLCLPLSLSLSLSLLRFTRLRVLRCRGLVAHRDAVARKQWHYLGCSVVESRSFASLTHTTTTRCKLNCGLSGVRSALPPRLYIPEGSPNTNDDENVRSETGESKSFCSHTFCGWFRFNENVDTLPRVERRDRHKPCKNGPRIKYKKRKYYGSASCLCPGWGRWVLLFMWHFLIQGFDSLRHLGSAVSWYEIISNLYMRYYTLLQGPFDLKMDHRIEKCRKTFRKFKFAELYFASSLPT